MGSEALQVLMPGFSHSRLLSRLLRAGSLPRAAPRTREVRSTAAARTLNQIGLNSLVLRSACLERPHEPAQY